MDWQTALLWVARLACPLAVGLVLWWLLRQSNEAPESPTVQRLRALRHHRATLEAEIEALEAQAADSAPVDNAQPTENRIV